MNRNDNKNDIKVNKTKVKTKRLLILLIIIAFLFIIYKITINYQLKTKVIAVVRFDFVGLENMFHSKYEYYAITENNNAIRISRGDMNKFYEDYNDDLGKYSLDENIYKFFMNEGKISDLYSYDFKFLTDDIQGIMEKISDCLIKMGKNHISFTLYTDKNEYIVETQNNGSTIYRYKNGELTKIEYCEEGDLYYIYFIRR